MLLYIPPIAALILLFGLDVDEEEEEEELDKCKLDVFVVDAMIRDEPKSQFVATLDGINL